MIDRASWLASLAPGDEVAIVSPQIQVRIERVSLADARHVVVQCGDARRYRRVDGHRVGVEYLADEHLVPVTQEHRDAIERDELLRRLRAVLDAEPTLDELRAMAAGHRSVRLAAHIEGIERRVLKSAGLPREVLL